MQGWLSETKNPKIEQTIRLLKINKKFLNDIAILQKKWSSLITKHKEPIDKFTIELIKMAIRGFSNNKEKPFNPNEEEKKNLLTYRQVILDPTVDDGLLYASQYGLLRSNDGGLIWEELKLLTPPSTTAIYSLVINPKNDREIYYATAKALYRSEDGGKNWITKTLPTSRSGKFLVIDFDETNILYLGVKQLD